MEQDLNQSIESIITSLLKVPGIKVDRSNLLMKIYKKYLPEDKLPILISKGPIEVGISVETIFKKAKSVINNRSLQSSGLSFLAGLPGGFALFGTIPADTIQTFAVALILAQELVYLYGGNDLWEDDLLDEEAVRDQFLLYLGVMLGVGGAATTLRLISHSLSQQVLKKLPQKALTKTMYYPLIKNIGKLVGIRVTKQTFSKGVSKAIPILGGIISGGLTYFSLKPMGERLEKTLYETTHYTEKDYKQDLQEIKNTFEEIQLDF